MLASLVACFVFASPAAAIDCGKIVDDDIVLKDDLECSGDGLIIRRGKVTIDLNGHVIRGDGVGQGIATATSASSTANLKITSSKGGGMIRNFGTGVKLSRAPHSILEKIRIQGNNEGVEIRSGGGANRDISVREIKVVGSLGIGLNVFDGSDFRVRDSRFVGNGTGVRLAYLDDSVVANNLVLASGGDGVAAGAVTNLQILSNSIYGAGDDGVDALGTGNAGLKIKSNKVRFTRSNGIALTNQVVSFAITGNEVQNARGYGLFVTSDGPGSIQSNDVSWGASDGIYVSDPAATLSGNSAIENAGVGIRSNAFDGGGNYARHNGEEDCIGVTCPQP